MLELKRRREAVGYLLAAEKLNPRDAQVLLALGRAYHALFDPARSREWYERAVDAAPRNGDAWFGLGVAYLDLAESAAAKLTGAFAQSAYVTELKEQHSSPCGSRAMLGGAPSTEQNLEQFASDAFCSANFKAAALAADRLRQQYPNHAAGWYWAVRVYQKLGVAALTRAGEVEPESPKIHAVLGDAYQRRSMFREAEGEYSKMLSLEPDDVAGLAGLADAYFADGQFEKAQAIVQKALVRDPADSEINLLMAEILVEQRNYAEAETYLEHSLHVRPDLLPRVHALLGRLLAKKGHSKEAINELTQGLASDEDGSVYYQLARLYQSIGDTKAAAAAFEKSEQIRAKRIVLAQETFSK